MKDPLTTLAFSMHSSPGVYALLLGSGVSRAARIMTGWEITLDLIRKVAKLKKENTEPDPEVWYQNIFHKEPDYADILEYIAPTPAERNALLRSYFEPNEKEREDGIKTPTEAHSAIASLVRQGYIRMILTTNFDRLLEIALQEEGITPDVISTDDALKGAMPYVHSKCVIIKLHGDYKDTRIKNTPEELKKYSSEINKYLYSILDDFGLIVCGWSGKWDEALRKAIMRRPTRRFTTYWATKGEPVEEAKRLIKHKRAQVIQIESADKFFTELKEKVESLSAFEPHPMSPAIAIETTKRYLAEDRYKIKLYELIISETEKLYQRIVSESFDLNVRVSNWEKELSRRIVEYEKLVEVLYHIIVTLTWFDQEGKHSEHIINVIERIANRPKPRIRPVDTIENLHRYPALLILYGIGISSIANNSFKNLYAALTQTKVRTFYKEGPAYKILYPQDVFSGMATNKIWEESYFAANERVAEICRKGFSHYIPDDDEYQRIFDIFEYLLGLIYFDEKVSNRGPVGRYAWKYYGPLASEPNLINEYITDGLAQGDNWGLIKTGFFDSSIEKFKKSCRRYNQFLRITIWTYM